MNLNIAWVSLPNYVLARGTWYVALALNDESLPVAFDSFTNVNVLRIFRTRRLPIYQYYGRAFNSEVFET